MSDETWWERFFGPTEPGEWTGPCCVEVAPDSPPIPFRWFDQADGDVDTR
ncbi:hypothetical protein EV383_4333 [Pseudonocardia sediminis]|uniref:Uncharacterized protein n=1 Tax=Pseudonocardia sediminis TaxID=1397368 RepID=A0A4V2FR63_PSEST|nr:hypothetical protein EV383_4333 [Pseudonocardia sediminis]